MVGPPEARFASVPTQLAAVPTVDLAPFLLGEQECDVQQLAEAVAAGLRDTGCLIVADPRVACMDNDRFLDMMERYFERPTKDKLVDSRPQLHYQVGVTPEGTEVPRCVREPDSLASISQQDEAMRPIIPVGADCKWRFFWRIGPRPSVTQFAELNAAPVVPEGFPEWREVMDGWGSKMLATVEAVAQLVAMGFGLQPNAFSRLMSNGPHLLGPTGTDLSSHTAPGACFAGWHYDLNFMTIHGRSRFPGLNVWLRDGRKVSVAIPRGCLLVQAGKQLEWLTAGHVRAGMHEVVCTEATIAAIQRARAEGRPLWRVSSTVFAHIASDAILEPLGQFTATPGYPPIVAGEQVQQELQVIKLSKG